MSRKGPFFQNVEKGQTVPGTRLQAPSVIKGRPEEERKPWPPRLPFTGQRRSSPLFLSTGERRKEGEGPLSLGAGSYLP